VLFTLPHVLDIDLCRQCIAFSPDGKRLLTAIFSDSLATVWDVTPGRSVSTVALSDRGYADGSIDSVAFSSDDRTLAFGTDAGMVRLWDTRAQQEVREFNGQGHATDFVAFSPDGKLLLVVN
jgi:WD40 repeat protein